MANTTSDLSIIIVSWNVEALLRDCLTSVHADLSESDLSADIWVVDNASTDGSVAMLRAEFPDAHLIASETNLGFAGGNNAALRAMGFPQPKPQQPKGVLLLNPDTLVQSGALKAMCDFLDANPPVGVVGANLTFGDGSFQHGAYRFPGLWQLAIDLFPLPGRLYESALNGRYPRTLYEGQTPFPIDHPLGAALLARREAIHQVGLMDEAYHMYVEEIDWCKRMQQANWQAFCVSTAHIVHLGGQSTEQIQTESFVNLWRSRRRFYRQYYGAATVMIARILVRWGMARKAREDVEQGEDFRVVSDVWNAD